MHAGTMLKWIGAASVLVSLLLPMSSCDLQPLTDETRMTYAFDDLSVTDPGSWIELLLLCWPAVFALLFTPRRRSKLTLALRIAEPLLLFGSLAMVLAYSALGQVEIGTRVAVTGLAIYAAGALVSDTRAVRSRPRARA